ncbi:MAG: LCP family protein [Bacillota bacterium]
MPAKKAGKIVRGLFLLGVGLCLGAAIRFWLWPRLRAPRRPATGEEVKLVERTNILVLGVDAPSPGSGEVRADVLMLVSCDPVEERVKLLSIPRDTLVTYPGKGEDRINAALRYGGVALARRMVEELTGLTVHRYLLVDFRAFEELVDLLGGVEVEVDKRMYYRDESQGLLIDLQKGRQTLNGRQALGFVRYRRDPMGDLARVARQQRLLRAVLEKAIKERLWTRLISLYHLKKEYVRNDLGLLDLYRLRHFAEKLASGADLATFTVPGNFLGPYWAPDRAALRALVEEEFTAKSASPVSKDVADTEKRRG